MPPRRRQPGSMCLCTSDGHQHMGSCTNKVWGHNKAGYLYKVCDACRVTVTLNEPGPKEQAPPMLTPAGPPEPEPPQQHQPLSPAVRDPLIGDPLWREPF